MKRYLKNKRVLRDCKIYQMLLTANKKRHYSFHTPGHKNAKWDITELSFSDNLSAPKGCIFQAEKDISTLLQAEKSFILTDGSTSGVLSMLYAAKRLGAKTVAFSLSSHKSVYNGCKILGLTPLVYDNDETKTLVYEKADVIFITSPDYYGKVADLKTLREFCDQNKKLLLIDGAHGGHLRFEKPLYAGSFADMWVDGVHKSLPAFTQGAVVSAKDERTAQALREGVDCFRTTSPSYPIMASVEYAVKYPRNTVLETEVKDFQKAFPARIRQNDDWTKLCVTFGEKAFAIEKQLESEGYFLEFCDGNELVFYLSPATPTRIFRRLKKKLITLFTQYPLSEKDVGRYALNENKTKNAPTVFELNETEWVKINEAENRICAALFGLFPPCTPLVRIGEKITQKEIGLLLQADNVFGVVDGKILVKKE